MISELLKSVLVYQEIQNHGKGYSMKDIVIPVVLRLQVQKIKNMPYTRYFIDFWKQFSEKIRRVLMWEYFFV